MYSNLRLILSHHLFLEFALFYWGIDNRIFVRSVYLHPINNKSLLILLLTIRPPRPINLFHIQFGNFKEPACGIIDCVLAAVGAELSGFCKHCEGLGWGAVGGLGVIHVEDVQLGTCADTEGIWSVSCQ